MYRICYWYCFHASLMTNCKILVFLFIKQFVCVEWHRRFSKYVHVKFFILDSEFEFVARNRFVEAVEWYIELQNNKNNNNNSSSGSIATATSLYLYFCCLAILFSARTLKCYAFGYKALSIVWIWMVFYAVIVQL